MIPNDKRREQMLSSIRANLETYASPDRRKAVEARMKAPPAPLVPQRAQKPLAEQTALFQAARRRYPNDPRFCLHLGRAAALAGQPQEAEQQFAAALALAGKANPGVAADELPRFQAEVAAARQQTK